MSWEQDPAPGFTIAGLIFAVGLVVLLVGTMVFGWGSTDCTPNYPCSTPAPATTTHRS